jgi:hypothetical protein
MDADFRCQDLVRGKIPYLGVLFKKSADHQQAINQSSRLRA